MRKIITLALVLLLSIPLFSDEITFSATESRVRLRNGAESVILAEDARVETGNLSISADNITLSGAEWRYIECSGAVTIEDTERNLTIRTSSIWYDRVAERLLIASYFEIDDRESEMSAMANHLEYDMASELLRLSSMVRFSKINGEDIIRGSSEQLIYDRGNEMLTLRGSCRVIYNGDEYTAEQINLDINNDSINLSSAIRGTING